MANARILGRGAGVVDRLKCDHRGGHHFGFITPDSGARQLIGLYFLLGGVEGGPVTVGDRVEFEEIAGGYAVHVRRLAEVPMSAQGSTPGAPAASPSTEPARSASVDARRELRRARSAGRLSALELADLLATAGPAAPGRVRGVLYAIVAGRRGQRIGFAAMSSGAEVYLDLAELDESARSRVARGAVLDFEVAQTPRGPRGADVRVVSR